MKQDLHIITGKGGVGKSVVALALAQRLARESGSVLLVELGEQSYFGPLLGISVGYKPVQVQAGLDLSLYNGESCLREYVEHLVKVPRIANLFFDNKVMRAFVKAAPGLSELAILGKLTSGIRQWGPEFNYRHVVLDAYSSGHFLALLKAPKGLAEIIDVGPMGEQSRAIFRVMSDSTHAHYSIITLPEEMPVAESLELHRELKDLTGIHAKLVVNRKLNSNSAEFAINPDVPWQAMYNEYFQTQNQKVKDALQVLIRAELPYVQLPFVMNVSAAEVAKQLSECGALNE